MLESDEVAKKDPSKAWQAETPYDTRQMAIQEAITALKACLTNKKRGHIQHFQMGYKSCKMPKQVFCVNDTAIQKVMKKAKPGKAKRGSKAKKQPTS